MSRKQKNVEIIDALISLFESSSDRIVLPLNSDSYDCVVRVGTQAEGYDMFFMKLVKRPGKEIDKNE